MPTLALPGDIRISEAEFERLVAGVEKYLAEVAPAPIRPGITRPDVEEMVRQAGIATGPAWRQKKPAAPEIELPGRFRSLLPRRRRAVQYVSVARHLELTLTVLERYGWARTGSGVSTATGRRCIYGAQLVLLSLGVGDHDTLDRAGGYLNHTLRTRGEKRSYEVWNESPRIDLDDVRQLITTAGGSARKAGH